jgi:hypothetical protein
LAQANDDQTYAIFNYETINWSGTLTSSGGITPSVAALNYGKNEGAVHLPFSGLPFENITALTTSGTYRGVPGRFIYRVTDRFERLGCLDLPDWYLQSGTDTNTDAQTQSITMNTYSADVFARRRLVLQSACVPDNVDQWLCGFRRNDKLSRQWTAKSPVYRVDQYSVVCESPRLFEADVGEWTIGVSLDAGKTWKYTEDFYLEGANSEWPAVEVVDSKLWYSANVTQPLGIKWSAALFSNVTANADVYLVAYRQNVDGSFVSDTYLDVRLRN